MRQNHKRVVILLIICNANQYAPFGARAAAAAAVIVDARRSKIPSALTTRARTGVRLGEILDPTRIRGHAQPRPRFPSQGQTSPFTERVCAEVSTTGRWTRVQTEPV